MNLALDRARLTFARAIGRANTTIHLHRVITSLAPPAVCCDDILRTSVVTAASAFDLLNHSAYRALLAERIERRTANTVIMLPLSVVYLDASDALSVVDDHIKAALSHRSFLQPDKISELYSPLVSDFWLHVSSNTKFTEPLIKSRLRELGRWRNRIVHEADVNPDLAGIGDWPIRALDCESAVRDYLEIGEAILAVLQAECSIPHAQ